MEYGIIFSKKIIQDFLIINLKSSFFLNLFIYFFFNGSFKKNFVIKNKIVNLVIKNNFILISDI